MMLFIPAILAMAVSDADSSVGDWRYDSSAEQQAVSVEVSTCYDQPDKHVVSLIWSDNQNDRSARIQCGCDETLLLNDKSVRIAADSLTRLLADGLKPEIRNYQCVPNK